MTRYRISVLSPDDARIADRYRARWLKLAQQYMVLLPTMATSAETAFTAEEEAKGTGQDDSGSSH